MNGEAEETLEWGWAGHSTTGFLRRGKPRRGESWAGGGGRGEGLILSSDILISAQLSPAGLDRTPLGCGPVQEDGSKGGAL